MASRVFTRLAFCAVSVPTAGWAGFAAYQAAHGNEDDTYETDVPQAVTMPRDRRLLTADELEHLSIVEGLNHVATHMDDHRHTFEQETDTFSSPKAMDKLQLRVWRNKVTYAGDAKVPVMRIMGYLPQITTSTVEKYLIATEDRKIWDPNYSDFDLLGPTLPMPISTHNALGELFPQARSCTGICADYTCTLSSKFFERVGIKPRLLCYHGFRFTANDQQGFQDSNRPKSILSRSLKLPDRLDELHDEKSRTMVNGRLERGATEVFIHYQQIVMVPIENRPQLDAMVEKFGGVSGSASWLPSKAELDAISSQKAPDAAHRGVLMVMTSVNDGKVRRMPRWIERQIGRFFGNLAQQSLMDFVKLKGDLEPVL